MSRIATRVLLSTFALAAVVAASSAGSADATGSPAPTVDHTTRIVLRPVTTTGTAAPGYAVHREPGSVDCSDQSVSAVDRGIDTCYPTAMYVPSCWKSSNHTVLCLRSVSDTRLVRVRYSGAFVNHAAVKVRSPQGLRLVGGGTCSIRIGGAWGQAPGHPTWLGFYACGNGALYGPPDGDGIDRSQPVWRVHVLHSDGSIVTRRVAVATYVGTAR